MELNSPFGMDYNQALQLARSYDDDEVLADAIMELFHHVKTKTGYTGVSYPRIASNLGHGQTVVEMAIRGRVDRFFRKLTELGLIDWPDKDTNERSEYRVLSALGEECRKDKTYRDLLFGPAYMASRTLPAVWFLEVQNPATGDTGQATSFHVGSGWFISCRHCVEPPQQVRVVDLEHQDSSWPIANLRMSSKRDIAVFKIEALSASASLAFAKSQASILDEVVVIHCPRVPRNHATKVVSSGEINARNTDYGTNTESFLISPRTGPGSSGGPVLNRRGQVCGLVDEFLFEAPTIGSESTPQMPYFHAIPGEEVVEFLVEIGLLKTGG